MCGREDGVFKPLPALALWREPDGKGHWRRALVMQYDEASEKFEVQYEDLEARDQPQPQKRLGQKVKRSCKSTYSIPLVKQALGLIFLFSQPSHEA